MNKMTNILRSVEQIRHAHTAAKHLGNCPASYPAVGEDFEVATQKVILFP